MKLFIPQLVEVPIKTQAEENDLATFCNSVTTMQIYNSTLAKRRYWNGTIAVSAHVHLNAFLQTRNN